MQVASRLAKGCDLGLHSDSHIVILKLHYKQKNIRETYWIRLLSNGDYQDDKESYSQATNRIYLGTLISSACMTLILTIVC